MAHACRQVCGQQAERLFPTLASKASSEAPSAAEKEEAEDWREEAPLAIDFRGLGVPPASLPLPTQAHTLQSSFFKILFLLFPNKYRLSKGLLFYLFMRLIKVLECFHFPLKLKIPALIQGEVV